MTGLSGDSETIRKSTNFYTVKAGQILSVRKEELKRFHYWVPAAVAAATITFKCTFPLRNAAAAAEISRYEVRNTTWQ